MSTMVLSQAPSPEPRSPAGPGPNFLAIRANLLPDEILAKRRLRELKRRMVVVLVIIAGLLVAWYGFVVLQTAQTKSDLRGADRTTASLQKQEQQFAPLVRAQSQAAAIKAELTRLMVGDLRWTDMLATLRKSAPAGISLVSVSGTVTSGGASSPTAGGGAAGLGVLNQTGHQGVGSLTISGTAPDKNSVAAYIDTLTKVTGLAAPFPASVTGSTGQLLFTANVIITSNALGGRYATQTTGGH